MERPQRHHGTNTLPSPRGLPLRCTGTTKQHNDTLTNRSRESRGCTPAALLNPVGNAPHVHEVPRRPDLLYRAGARICDPIHWHPPPTGHADLRVHTGKVVLLTVKPFTDFLRHPFEMRPHVGFIFIRREKPLRLPWELLAHERARQPFETPQPPVRARTLALTGICDPSLRSVGLELIVNLNISDAHTFKPTEASPPPLPRFRALLSDVLHRIADRNIRFHVHAADPIARGCSHNRFVTVKAGSGQVEVPRLLTL